MAPRGNLNFFVCTYNLKINYEQLLFDITCITFLCLSLICFYQIHLHLCFMCFDSSVLESQSDVWKSAFRSWDIFGSLWVFPNGLDLSLFTALDGPTKQRSCPLRKGRVKCLFWELTHLFWFNFLPFPFFSIEISTENIHRSQILHLSITFGKVLV
jgi:hypothetical protein